MVLCQGGWVKSVLCQEWGILQNIPFWLHNVPGTVIMELVDYNTDMY